MTIASIPSYTMPEPSSFPANKVDWQFDATKTVFLIHDMQEYFISFYDKQSPLIQVLLSNLVTAKRYCVNAGIPVVYTAQPREQNIADRALLNDMWGPGLNKAPELQSIIAELAPQEGDTVLDKWRYSAFQRSPLEHMMSEMGRDQLLIGGIYGHIGCLMTAVDAFMRDIKPFMLGDAIADFSLPEHKMALQYVATRAGVVLSTEQLISHHGQPAISRDNLLAKIAKLVDEPVEEFDPDENLIDYGLDSVQIMSLLTEWRTAGIMLNFVQIAEVPTFNQWWSMIEAQLEGEV
ncbi:isochorismatase family protein [Vibrio sp. WXL103]|uniref:isochorismatase family protein n=1 Tax=Vibrio sp. WXL103 TaxID=3450710 RepID=UPI003EC54966